MRERERRRQAGSPRAAASTSCSATGFRARSRRRAGLSPGGFSSSRLPLTTRRRRFARLHPDADHRYNGSGRRRRALVQLDANALDCCAAGLWFPAPLKRGACSPRRLDGHFQPIVSVPGDGTSGRRQSARVPLHVRPGASLGAEIGPPGKQPTAPRRVMPARVRAVPRPTRF